MSYHSTLGAGFSVSASATLQPPKCSSGAQPTWSKTGWSCPKLATAPTPKPQAKDTVIPTAVPTATAVPTPQAVKYGTLLWSDTHKIAAPVTTYTKAPPKAPTAPVRTAADYQAEAEAASTSAQRSTGMNWLPWALGAVGVGALFLLLRKRQAA